MCVLVKKLSDGHAGLVEARDVGRLIGIRLQHELEAGGDVGLLEDARPDRARAGRLHGELVVHHAADHVEVEIRGELVDRHRRLVDERVRSDQADLLGRPERRAARCAAAAASTSASAIAEHGGACPTRCRRRRDGCGRPPPCSRASCRGRRVRDDRSARRARPTAARRRSSAVVAGRYATTLRPVCVSRWTAALTVTVASGNGEAGDVRVAASRAPSARPRGLLSVAAGEDRAPGLAADAGGDDARAGERRVERHRNRLAGVRRARARRARACALAPRCRAAIAL